MRAAAIVSAWLLAQRGHLFGWVPVAFGLGVGLYFAAPVEPIISDLVVVAALGLTALALVRPLGSAFGPLAIGVALLCAGFALAAVRAQTVSGPVLGFRYYGAIEGRIVVVDRSRSDAVRLTLDQVLLEDMREDRTPIRVRVSLHGTQDWMTPEPGLRVMTTGHLAPPSGPAEPGDFDFRRSAWFDRIGAVGYTRNPVLVVAPADPKDTGLIIDRLRSRISAFVRSRISGEPGGYAAAVTTGDRSGLSPETSDALRAANLYHLVSISGMHMGMLSAFVFMIVQFAVAAVPPLALRVSAKKIAALGALPVAAFYLALAGRGIPTERAFITVAVMLGAVLMDRQAITLRSVAIAALIVLALRPESLVNPGFQMSFAAVVALVFAYGLLPRRESAPTLHWRIIVPVLGLMFSSLIAGSATAPYAAAHFNRIAHYGVLANLLAVPAMGILVMPGAVMLAVLAPLGLEAPAVWMMETGARWILFVAEAVAGLGGAVSAVPSPPALVLPVLSLAGLWLVLWQGRGKAAAAVPAAVAAALWVGAERPSVLVADTGGLVGVLTEEGRALSKPRGDGFAASVWLENDGWIGDQAAAAALHGATRVERVTRVSLGGHDILQVSGKTALAALPGCDGATVLIVTVDDAGARPCLVLGPRDLRRTGALAISERNGALDIETANERAGRRLWSQDEGQHQGLLGALFRWHRPDGRTALQAELAGPITQ